MKSKPSPFGAAKPVDTDFALKKVEERLAKEKEHKEELVSSKAGVASKPSSNSPTAPRHDKGKTNPKQLLRRTSATSSAQSSAGREIDSIVTAKGEVQEEAISENQESSWRKPENNPVASPPVDEEAGWETVPSRNKKVNGVAARH